MTPEVPVETESNAIITAIKAKDLGFMLKGTPRNEYSMAVPLWRSYRKSPSPLMCRQFPRSRWIKGPTNVLAPSMSATWKKSLVDEASNLYQTGANMFASCFPLLKTDISPSWLIFKATPSFDPNKAARVRAPSAAVRLRPVSKMQPIPLTIPF